MAIRPLMKGNSPTTDNRQINTMKTLLFILETRKPI